MRLAGPSQKHPREHMRQITLSIVFGAVIGGGCFKPSTEPHSSVLAPCTHEPSWESFSEVEAEACERACDQGDPSSCVTLGLAYEKGHGVFQDSERAYARYHHACVLGHVPGCSREAGKQMLGVGTDWDPPKAVEMVRRTCEQGDAYGCFVLGFANAEGFGVPKDRVRAAVFFRRACDGGNMEGCVDLGVLYSMGNGVVKDVATAQVLEKKACDGGEQSGCTWLARLQLGDAVLARMERGIQGSLTRLEQQCIRSWNPVCSEPAQSYATGKFGDFEITRAASWLAVGAYHGDGPSMAALHNLPSTAFDHLNQRCMEKLDAIACAVVGHKLALNQELHSRPDLIKRLDDICTAQKNPMACALLAAHHSGMLGSTPNWVEAERFAKSSCDHGEGNGCEVMAGLLDGRAYGAAKDLAKGFPYRRRACHLGLASACADVGRMYTYGDGVKMNHSLGFRLVERGCKGGDGAACTALYEYYSKGWEPAKQDMTQAVSAVEQACAAGLSRPCYTAGTYYLNGQHVPEDEEKGFKLIKKACDTNGKEKERAKDEEACRIVDVLSAVGWGTTRDKENGEKTLRRLCDKDEFFACAVLGGMLAIKDSDSVEVLEKQGKACNDGKENGIGSSCYFLAEAYSNGTGVGYDLAKVALRAEQGCRLGNPDACSLLGTLYLHGNDATASELINQSFQKQACELGSMRGCAALAELHEKGRGVERNGAKAVELYEKACTGDYAAACRRLGEMLLDGKGVPKRDPGTAADKLEKASRLGDTDAINKLLELRADGWVAPRRLEETLELSCFTGHWPACRSLAFLWWAPPANSLIERRPASALRHAEKACKENDLPACGIAARVYAKGADRIPERKLDIDKATRKPTRIIPAQGAITRDEKLALERYKKACGEGVSVSFSAASIGLGPKPDARSAVAPVVSAEQQNDPASCYEWAQRDKQRAPELLERACRGGYERACAQANKNAGKSAP